MEVEARESLEGLRVVQMEHHTPCHKQELDHRLYLCMRHQSFHVHGEPLLQSHHEVESRLYSHHVKAQVHRLASLMAPKVPLTDQKVQKVRSVEVLWVVREKVR